MDTFMKIADVIKSKVETILPYHFDQGLKVQIFHIIDRELTPDGEEFCTCDCDSSYVDFPHLYSRCEKCFSKIKPTDQGKGE